MTLYCTFDPFRPVDPSTGLYYPTTWQQALRGHCRAWVERRWNQYRTVLAFEPYPDPVVTEPDIMASVRELEATYAAIAADEENLLWDQVLDDDYVPIATEAMLQGLSVLSLDMPLEDGPDDLVVHDPFDGPPEPDLAEEDVRHGQAAPTLLPERQVIARIAYERSVYLSSPPERTGIRDGQPRVTRWRRCLHPDGTVQWAPMRLSYQVRTHVATIALSREHEPIEEPCFEDLDPFRYELHEEDTATREDLGYVYRCQCSLQDPRRPKDRTRPNCSRWDASGDDHRFSFDHHWYEAEYEPRMERIRRHAIPQS